jgi:hypothetical protein
VLITSRHRIFCTEAILPNKTEIPQSPLEFIKQNTMGTLGGRARRLAKRQQYEATHEKAVGLVASAADRPAVRAGELNNSRLLKGKGNASL